MPVSVIRSGETIDIEALTGHPKRSEARIL
jgi:hypothetical protein